MFRSAVIDAPLQRRAFCLTYFFFAFFTADFLLFLDDFLAVLLELDFEFADFDAENFLGPLPFLAGSD